LEKPVSKSNSIQLFITAFILTLGLNVMGQQPDTVEFPLNYERPTEYVIGGITVTGTQYIDRNLMTLVSGLKLGQTIKVPGSELNRAIEKLWKQQLFSDIEIRSTGTKGKLIYLNIHVQERPRMSRFSIRGLKKSETKNLKEELSLRANQIITEDLKNATRNEIRSYFKSKGYFNVDIDIVQEQDTNKRTHDILRINIDRGSKVKVQEIVFVGNENIQDKKLRKMLKPKQLKRKWNIFASSKYVEADYESTKPDVINHYLSNGYRDAAITYDSIIPLSDDRIKLKIGISEGEQYYFRNITWVGNSKYRSSLLDTILGIKKGDLFDQGRLEQQLFMSQTGLDVSSLYMDDGYLFFNVTPVEVQVVEDSIDLEIRIYEGKQATVNRVFVTGNDKTSDHVILRTLRTRPGQKFSRSDIQRSMRELAALGYFDPEALDVNPIPNPANGTVDIQYKVVEKSSDQIEASGGWGGFQGFVGTIGLSLNNFAARKVFEKGGWDPIPAGDGQRLSLRVQSNGTFFQSYNFSFTEPWLGGKKPNSFTTSVFHSIQSNSFTASAGSGKLKTTGASVTLGKLLKWPDDYFTLSLGAGYQRYGLENWNGFGSNEIGFNNGFANNITVNATLARNSTDHPIYPSTGSQFSLSLQATPPYSSFRADDINYDALTPQERFKWVEYHKWKVNAQWYLGFPRTAKKKFVISPALRYGVVGLYNNNVGYSPFEQFAVGGSGLSGFVLYGTEIVSQRGYDERTISEGGTMPIFTRYTIDLRYPLSLNQSATVYLHTFLEAGNAYQTFKDFDPYNVKRAYGTGVRLFLPMFGLLGFDYAWGVDKGPNEQKGIFHFFLGQTF
jgi:outer membrane protein insertion porin family